jgi:predicted dithiol-disulfide oxidoreductase (DUF899 family)
MQHPVVSRDEWIAARKALLLKEKQLTRQRDQLAAERRRLPWVKVGKAYVLDGPNGKETLADLFDGRSQLIIQHFMFGPDWEEGCVGCSFGADHVDSARQHFEHRDLSFAAVSRTSIAKIEAFKRRMGWTFKWVSSLDSGFNYDFGVSFTKEQLATGKVFHNFEMIENSTMEDLPGGSVFFKDSDGSVYLTYADCGDGTGEVLGTYMILDLMPKGRNESGAMDWIRRHDEYEQEKKRKAG